MISERDLIKSSYSTRERRRDEGKKTCYCNRQAIYGRKCFVEICGCARDGCAPSSDEMFSLRDLNALFLE